jgi:hypothetical protein
LTDATSEPGRVGEPARPAQVTMPASVPPHCSVASATALSRPVAVDKSATTDAGVSGRLTSMPMTRHPPAPSLAEQAAPIPDAAPVTTT